MNDYIYLIIPPIIIVIGLAGMIYLISRRSSDIQKKKEDADKQETNKRTLKEKISKLGLRLLERLTRWFKISSLKLHNITEKWLSKISQKRKKYIRKEDKENNIKPVSDKKNRRKFFFWKRSDKESKNDAVKDDALSTEKNAHSFKNDNDNTEMIEKKAPKIKQKKIKSGRMDVMRGMISKKVVYPEKKKEKSELEKILIERIAINPKDIEAYERLGNYYEEIKEWQDAEACYRQVLKLSVNNYRVKMRLERVQRIIRKSRYQ